MVPVGNGMCGDHDVVSWVTATPYQTWGAQTEAVVEQTTDKPVNRGVVGTFPGL